MKKFIKGSFITSGILILMGIILLVMCASVGGVGLFKEAIENNEFCFGYPGFGEGHIYFNHDFDWEDDQYPNYAGTQKNIIIGDGRNIKNVKVEIDGGALEVNESADDQIRLDCDVKGKISCYIENDTLILKGEKYSDNHNDKISLYLPKDIYPDDIEIKLGAGKITMNTIRTGKLSADIGAGSLAIQNADIEHVDLNAGVGKIDFMGTIRGDIDAKCGVGNIDMQINGDKGNWNYDVECAAGKVSIGEDEYENLVRNVEINYEADNDCDIACAIGKVELSFY